MSKKGRSGVPAPSVQLSGRNPAQVTKMVKSRGGKNRGTGGVTSPLGGANNVAGQIRVGPSSAEWGGP